MIDESVGPLPFEDPGGIRADDDTDMADDGHTKDASKLIPDVVVLIETSLTEDVAIVHRILDRVDKDVQSFLKLCSRKQMMCHASIARSIRHHTLEAIRPLFGSHESALVMLEACLMRFEEQTESLTIPASVVCGLTNPKPPISRRIDRLRAFLTDLSLVNPTRLQELQESLAVDALPDFANVTTTRDRNAHAFSSELSATSSISAIRLCLLFLDRMDTVHSAAMIRTNCAYWVLGSYYEDYQLKLDLTCEDQDLKTSSRKQTSRVLNALWREMSKHTSSNSDDIPAESIRRKAFVQRVQRARKYILLTRSFPESVLLAVPFVCVSRLDKLSMDELNSLLMVEEASIRTEIAHIRSLLLPLNNAVKLGLENICHSLA